MARTPTRREFLVSGSIATTVGLSGCSGDGRDADSSTDKPTSTATSSTTETVTRTPEEHQIAPIEHDKLIGAHYYVWYNSDSWWENWLRRVPAEPVLGEYSSYDESVINQHITWAREHGINWFNVSWWGPDSDENYILYNNVLDAGLSNYIDFSILYESGGRFEPDEQLILDFDVVKHRVRLRRDFEYLDRTYFGRSNYLEIDGRPVVFMYLAHRFGGDVKTAFQEAKGAINTEPYLIAGMLTPGSAHLQSDWLEEFDAVSTYNIYSQDIAAEGDYTDFVPYATKRNGDWVLAGEYHGFDVFPNIIPGYNDSLYRDNPVLERDSEGFRELSGNLIEQLDSDLDAIMITSANEWPEYTAVFPAERYGTTYLEIIKEKMANPAPGYLDSNGFDLLQLEFNTSVQPSTVNSDSNDTRFLSFLLAELELRDSNGDSLISYDIGVPQAEPYIVDGAYAPGGDEDSTFENWRWIGGELARAAFYFDTSQQSVASANLWGIPVESDEIEADVYFNGKRTDHIQFGERSSQTYSLSLF